MRKFQRTAQFKRDVKRLGKRGKDLGKLKEVLLALAVGDEIAQLCSDHRLLKTLEMLCRRTHSLGVRHLYPLIDKNKRSIL